MKLEEEKCEFSENDVQLKLTEVEEMKNSPELSTLERGIESDQREIKTSHTKLKTVRLQKREREGMRDEESQLEFLSSSLKTKETEMKDKKLRLEDAINATRAAVDEAATLRGCVTPISPASE